LKGSFEHSLRRPNHGEDGPVVGGIRLDIEQAHSGDRGDGRLQLSQNRRVATLTEIGNALDDLRHQDSLSTVVSQACISELPATMDPCLTTSGEPSRSLTTPPASRIIRVPAA